MWRLRRPRSRRWSSNLCRPSKTIGLMRQAAHNALQCDPTRGDAEFYGTIHRIMRTHKDASIAAAYRWLDFAPDERARTIYSSPGAAPADRQNGPTLFVYLQKAARLQPYATCFETWFAVGLFCPGRAGRRPASPAGNPGVRAP